VNVSFAKCAKCGSVYCSREDQVTHWKNGHKQECKLIVEQANIVAPAVVVVVDDNNNKATNNDVDENNDNSVNQSVASTE
jgi:hypothetical protein